MPTLSSYYPVLSGSVTFPFLSVDTSFSDPISLIFLPSLEMDLPVKNGLDGLRKENQQL